MLQPSLLAVLGFRLGNDSPREQLVEAGVGGERIAHAVCGRAGPEPGGGSGSIRTVGWTEVQPTVQSSNYGKPVSRNATVCGSVGERR